MVVAVAVRLEITPLVLVVQVVLVAVAQVQTPTDLPPMELPIVAAVAVERTEHSQEVLETAGLE